MSFSCSSRTYRAYFTPTSKPIVAPTRKFAKLNQFTPPSVLCSVCWPFVLPLAWDECRFFSFPWPPLLLRSSDIVQLKQTLIKKRRTTLIHEWKLNWNVRWSTPSSIFKTIILYCKQLDISACVMSCYNFAPRWRNTIHSELHSCNFNASNRQSFMPLSDRELCTYRLIPD